MTAIQQENSVILSDRSSLFDDYPWYFANFYSETKKALEEFFNKDFTLRFMGISLDENVLFYGDEYFVNKLPVTKNGDFKVKLSSNVVSCLLDNAVGVDEKRFELKALTDIEAMLIKSFTAFLYRKLEGKLNKSEVNKKVLQNSKEYSFTYYLQSDKKHIGKIIVTLPDFLIGDVTKKIKKDLYSISDFKEACVNVKLAVGKSKIALNEIKVIEDGDVILLENSDINTMAVVWGDNEFKFRINPEPSLIISVDNNGDNEMEEEISVKSQNMWDSILVDIVAEFDNVKLTLGELKQISEGCVIDVGSVYDNKIKLRVENQVVATGELVILNDRYGVRIDSVKKTKEMSKETVKSAAKSAKASGEPVASSRPSSKRVATRTAANKEQPASGETVANDENFDYSDFEIEDESI